MNNTVFQTGLLAGTAMPFYQVFNTVFFSLFFISIFSVNAAIPEPPITFSYEEGDPANFADGDTVSLICTYGTQSEPGGPANSFNLVYDYSNDGFIISNSALSVDLDGSWACEGSNSCESSVWIDHVNKKIHISISRTDGELQSGYGLFCSVGGIIVEIDDVHAKQANAHLKIQSIGGVTRISHNLEFIEWVGIYELTGRNVGIYRISGNEVKVPFSPIPTSGYLFRVKTNKGIYERKIRFIQ